MKKDGKHIFADLKNDEGKKIGKIGMSFYDDIKALGIGSFEIFLEFRRKGYGTEAIKNLVKKFKDKYDFIYCFVDKDNKSAIAFYKKNWKVNDEEGPNDNGQYLVEIFKKSGYKVPD